MGLQVDIKKKLGNFQLVASFEIENETLALLGASGCGKSMTLKCIAGIEKPDEGRIVLDDQILFDSKKKINLAPQQRSIGYLFQNYALFPNMTVEENMSAGLKLPKSEQKAVIDEKIKTFFLEGLEKKRPHQLSGGQQQRVALARMLCANPKMIMLDEPFSALDSYLRWQLEQEMMDIIESYQKPTLFVSHNRDEVYRISDKVGVMEHGRLNGVTQKKELFKNPMTLMGALLTGCKNFSKIEKRGVNLLYAIDWGIELDVKKVILKEHEYVGIRAHDIRVLDMAHSSNSLECRIKKVIENTFTYILLLEGKNHSEIRLEIKKEVWNDWLLEHQDNSNKITIMMNPEDLILVRSS